VTEVFHHAANEMADYYLIINENLCVTPNHPLFINGKWLAAGDAELGDCLLSIDGKAVDILSIETVFKKVPTYNLEIETFHNYFAGGILAHNIKIIELYDLNIDPSEPPNGL
jgi:intein/homing endonuclease